MLLQCVTHVRPLYFKCAIEQMLGLRDLFSRLSCESFIYGIFYTWHKAYHPVPLTLQALEERGFTR